MGIWNIPMTSDYLMRNAEFAEPCFWCIVILASFFLLGGALYLCFLTRARGNNADTDKNHAK